VSAADALSAPLQELHLPALRKELQMFSGEPLPSGAPSWLLFDPVRNAYHRLERAAFERLSLWQAEPVSQYLARLNMRFDTHCDEEDVKDMVTFLYAQKLVLLPPGGNAEQYAAQEFAANPPLSHTLIHKYLFFRIPLIRPDAFLRRAYPWVAWMFTRIWLITVISLGATGLYFAIKQWDQFTSTFLHFLTFEGLMFYGLTLAGLKIIHEFGHAFTARHFGSRVPVMGLAFLVMFPILYTDTTNAWELTDRRKRVLIDAGGMLAELMMACLAIFAWSFLPDGPLRSAAFFTATTSWVLSLMVNLNPMMRFDGYYLLTDHFRAPNLQTHGFEMGRWHMRERLFGLGEPRPENASGLPNSGLITYAYATWIYRFFLFIGIAILVHALFPKAIGIILFTVEIGWFIVKPIVKELKIWGSLRMSILSSKRGRVTSALLLTFTLLMCWPWQKTITAPAIMRPAQHIDVFPHGAGKVETLLIINGQSVEAGDILAILQSDTLDEDISLTQRRLALTEAQIARRGADAQDLANSVVLLQQRTRERAKLAGLAAAQQDLIIRAPHNGQISDLSLRMHEGRWVSATERLARITRPSSVEIIAFPHEDDAARLSESTKLTFIPDDILAPRSDAHIIDAAAVSETYLREDILSSDYRGPIAVSSDKDGQAVPKTAIFRLRAQTDTQTLRAVRGVARIEAKRQSPAKAFMDRVGHVLIREADF